MSRTISLFIFSLFFLYSKLAAQCPTSQINLTSQVQVNAFPTDYPGCTHLTNNLYISGSDITTLSPLNVITAVDGFLSIVDNANLASLSGFSNLDSVQAIDLIGNPLLQNLNGLSDLDEVDLYVNIDNNDGLLNLNGLTNLSQIGPNGNDGYLVINDNQLLIDLTGAPLLDSLTGLLIGNNPFLPDFDGFEGLKKVDTLFITGNGSIDNLNGFDNLAKVFNLKVVENHQLINFQGAPMLTHLDSLYAEVHDALVNFSGLESIESLKKCYIGANLSLTDFTGLNNVTKIDQLIIGGNESMINFNGLNNLDTVGYFSIQGNPLITDLSGLDSLRQVTHLSISFNNSLETIDDLGRMIGECTFLSIIFNDNLQSVRTSVPLDVSGYTHVTSNPQLEECCFLLNPVQLPNLSLFLNAPSCNTIPAIMQYCDSDEDGLDIPEDNCPFFYNPLQQDSDADGVGNGCDNCPLIANADQADSNDNFIGNACETAEAGKIGLGNTTPKSQLDVSGGDLYLNNTQRGIILKNYLGECFRLVVDEDGALHTVQITCPN